MSTFVRSLTITLIALTVITGIFVEYFLGVIGAELPKTEKLRWLLILGMPIVLLLSFLRFNQQPAKTPFAFAMQSFELLALFFAPYLLVVGHST